MSNAAMETHSTVFVTIDKLVSPSSPVNWNPLDDFPDHGNLVFPPSFPFPGQGEGRTGPPPPDERSLRSWPLGRTGPPSRGVRCLARGTRETRCLLIGETSIRRVTNGLGDPRVRWSRDRFVAHLFFGSNPVLDIFSVFAAALKIQLMSPASDLFSRWFSESNHCNLLGCKDCLSANRPPFVRCGLLAVCRDGDLYLLRLRLLTLRHMQAQDPIAILGPNTLGVDCVR